MKEAIKDFILNELVENRSNVELSTSDDILSGGIIDSMGAMQLVNFIEDRFSVRIPPEDMVIENFITIDAIGVYIEKRKEHKR